MAFDIANYHKIKYTNTESLSHVSLPINPMSRQHVPVVMLDKHTLTVWRVPTADKPKEK